MSALDKLKEQKASETSAVLMSRLEDVEEQTRELTNAVNRVSGLLKAMDEAQSAEMKCLSESISQLHEQPSPTQLVGCALTIIAWFFSIMAIVIGIVVSPLTLVGTGMMSLFGEIRWGVIIAFFATMILQLVMLLFCS